MSLSRQTRVLGCERIEKLFGVSWHGDKLKHSLLSMDELCVEIIHRDKESVCCRNVPGPTLLTSLSILHAGDYSSIVTLLKKMPGVQDEH